jgi:hypothetical protein
VNVHVIFDRSALDGYLAMDVRSLAAGEMLTSVNENGGVVGVPAVCYAEAFAAAEPGQRRRLRQLIENSDGVTAVLPLMWPEVADVGEVAGRIGVGPAHAVAETLARNAQLATFEPGVYAKELSVDESILDLSQ